MRTTTRSANERGRYIVEIMKEVDNDSRHIRSRRGRRERLTSGLRLVGNRKLEYSLGSLANSHTHVALSHVYDMLSLHAFARCSQRSSLVSLKSRRRSRISASFLSLFFHPRSRALRLCRQYATSLNLHGSTTSRASPSRPIENVRGFLASSFSFQRFTRSLNNSLKSARTRPQPLQNVAEQPQAPRCGGGRS